MINVKYSIRIISATVGSVFLIYTLCMFHSASSLKKEIQGHWITIDYDDEYIFTDKEYIHGTERGFYMIKGNKLIFGSGDEFFIRVKDSYLFFDGNIYIAITD